MTNNEKATCPVCGKEVNSGDLYCRHCGSEVTAFSAYTESDQDGQYSDVDLGEEDYGKTAEELENELSELDYEPKKKSGFLVPALVIALVLVMVIGVIYMISSADDDQPVADDPLEVPVAGSEDDQPGVEDPTDEVTAPADPDEDQNENGLEEDIPPDYDLLEAAMEEWLVERLNDPDVILLHTDELENFDQFFDTYDLEEDNIIVYMVDSTEDEFATVLLGPPFSEWSIKAVYIWRDGQWDFLREEAIS